MAYFRKRPFKKFATKVKRRAVTGVRNRYIQKGPHGKGYNINNIIRDVRYIKSALNTERKHLDTLITNTVTASLANNTKHPTANPYQGNSVIYPLAVPSRGTAFNQRVGNQLKLTNISVRYIIQKTNTSNTVGSTSLRCFIFFAKNAEDVPNPNEIFETDANGLISPASYWNSQEYKNFYFPKGLTYRKTIRDNTNRSTGLENGVPASQIVRLYPKTSVKMQTKLTFENDSDFNLTMMKPYIMFVSDGTGANTDAITVDAQIRLSYVDN